MKKIKVEVCVCTGCVMNGAPEILEAIESLQELKNQMNPYEPEEESSLEVVTNRCLGGDNHHDKSPLVSIDGELFPRANSETIMSHLITKTREND